MTKKFEVHRSRRSSTWIIRWDGASIGRATSHAEAMLTVDTLIRACQAPALGHVR